MYPHRNPVLGTVYLDEPDYSSEDSDEPMPRLYVSLIRFCPYTERIRIILSIKGNPARMLKCIDSIDNPGDFLKRNHVCKIPYIKYDDKVIYDSLEQADFLDEQYPELPLWNCSPSQKIVDKLLIESFAKVETAVHKLFMTTREVKKENFEELVACLTPFEVELVKRGTNFFGGKLINSNH
ncbi:pyrimidodiazepine synthase-like [Acyrthosiphon pisum]|uniref:GST N-terminal domain-containing protein n=1 Tax=Acyrthosiphon pisum TaxID=7029 RepID=A0A8R2B8T7_ACYPI|nr:pyrimidodiazepine synthase-like [Acyrthosiphon pisum]|eukprot:XP_008187468.1 PREDICTED: pyrimidodiazepine synthase-like [Acyrthosiphon pisum]